MILGDITYRKFIHDDGAITKKGERPKAGGVQANLQFFGDRSGCWQCDDLCSAYSCLFVVVLVKSGLRALQELNSTHALRNHFDWVCKQEAWWT